MSGNVSMRITLRKLSMLLCVPAMLVGFVISASSDAAHAPLSGSIEASATPSGIRSRIDIGPLRELAPIFGREQDDQLSEFMHLVEDPNGVLSQTQASVLAEDAHRLTVHGIPTMFVFRESAQSPEESAIYANQLRRDKKLETTPGADDGFLFLITQGTETPSRSMFLTMSFGAHTFPKGGLNETTLQDVYQQSIRPRMRFGFVSDALKVGIRKIIYLETYYPDPPPPLTSQQKAMRAILKVTAPILSLAALVSVVLSWRSTRHGSPWGRRGLRRRYTIGIVLSGALVMIVAALAVYSRSESGVIAMSLGVLAIAAHIHLLAGDTAMPRRPLRRVHAASRFPVERVVHARAARAGSVDRRAALPQGPRR